MHEVTDSWCICVFQALFGLWQAPNAHLSTTSFASSGAVADINAEIEHATGLERYVVMYPL